VKTDVEELSPTRVKLTIEVPFDELKPSLDKAYREVAKQIRVPGFRPGRVPPPVIDQRFGRGVVLEQAVNDAVPELYGRALEENEVFALGQPDLEITNLDDGKQLAFTAEVDIRPAFDLPDVDGMPVTVDDANVTPDEVEEYLGTLRERFASLKTVDRAAAEGDYVSIDLSASADGQEVEDAQASGLSYQLGDDSLLDGLDEALTGMSAGESRTFQARLAGGEHAGEEADVTVTVHSVKVQDLPELDDSFAQLASEFDTLGELRADTRGQLERFKRTQQVSQARDRALEALMAKIDIPLPEKTVADEVRRRSEGIDEQLQRSGRGREEYLETVGKTAEELDTEIEQEARRSVKMGFVLDKFAMDNELGVDEGELSTFVVQQAQRMGVAPDQLARHLTESGQVTAVVQDVLRSKALDLLMERAAIKDESGRDVDPKEIIAEAARASTADAEAAAEAAVEAATEATGESPAGVPAEGAPEGPGEASGEGAAGDASGEEAGGETAGKPAADAGTAG
jgi:trigger factor